MDFEQVPGREWVEAVVEIPRGSRNKYEYDHHRNVIALDRRLFSATYYPADYGFVTGTLSEDGDPLDILVIVEEATFPGCHIRARPIGMFSMRDEHGPDCKVISVPAGDPRYDLVDTLDGLPLSLTKEIQHFFEVYKDLEPGKWTEASGFSDADAAWAEIRRSRDRLTAIAESRGNPEHGGTEG